MMELSGKISDRIRSGDIPADSISSKRPPFYDPPKADSIRHGSGQGLGQGATRARAGEGAQTHDD